MPDGWGKGVWVRDLTEEGIEPHPGPCSRLTSDFWSSLYCVMRAQRALEKHIGVTRGKQISWKFPRNLMVQARKRFLEI